MPYFFQNVLNDLLHMERCISSSFTSLLHDWNAESAVPLNLHQEKVGSTDAVAFIVRRALNQLLSHTYLYRNTASAIPYKNLEHCISSSSMITLEY